MAIVGKLRVVSNSGTGDGSVKIYADSDYAYNRLDFTETLKIDVDEVDGQSSADTTIKVTKTGRGNYIAADTSTYSLTSSGGTVTITGYCNYANAPYVVSISGDTSYISGYTSSMKGNLSLTINGTSYSQGATITGDPGATGRYTFTLSSFKVNANTTTSAKTIKIALGATSTTATKYYTITLAAASS
jgi:hypothetical protein